MRNYNKEVIFISDYDYNEIDRISVLYDPELEVGDIYINRNESMFHVTSKTKALDSAREKEYFIYYVRTPNHSPRMNTEEIFRQVHKIKPDKAVNPEGEKILKEVRELGK